MNNLTWQSYSKVERYRNISNFMKLKPDRLDSLGISELALLFQWVFEQRGLIAVRTDIQGNRFDFELDRKGERGHREYVRVYLENPVSAVYNTTTHLKGRDIKKIYLFTFGQFPDADKNAQNDNPLFLELKERQEIIRMVQETQTNYRKALRTKHDYYVISEAQIRKPKITAAWSRFKQMVRNLMK